MAQAKSDQPEDDAKRARAAKKAAAEAEKRRAEDVIRNRRVLQLETSQEAIRNLEESLETTRESTARHAALTSHLEGFYEEIDKLTKGKAQLEVTPFFVEQANDTIRDAKAIIEGDVYLDRIKEFVPAGNNPVYPDVLVTLRVVRQCLERFGIHLGSRKRRLSEVLSEAKTIAVALEYLLAENCIPSKKDVEEMLGGESVPDSFFSWNVQHNLQCFDFELLDDQDLDEFLSAKGDPQGEEE